MNLGRRVAQLESAGLYATLGELLDAVAAVAPGARVNWTGLVLSPQLAAAINQLDEGTMA